MNSGQAIIISAIICLTFLNFLMWSKTNYGAAHNIPAQVNELYNSFLEKTPNSEDINLNLKEIRNKLDEEMNILRSLKSNSSPKSFDDHFQKMKEFSVSQVSTRKKTLFSINGAEQFWLLYGSLAPEVFCPEKVRVGTVGDGGKWVCNPWKTPRDSILFSLGLNNYIGFEIEWQKITNDGSVLYGFDEKEQNEKIKEIYSKMRGVTKQVFISEQSSADTKSIADLAKEANVTSIEVLKIDIEGAELTCLVPFLNEYPVCQIYLEVHGGANEHAKLLGEIAHLRYRLFSYEVNGYSMKACEYSFIRDDCVEKYGGLRVAEFLDFNN